MKKILWIFLLLPTLLQAQINKDSLWTIWEDVEEQDSNRLAAIKDLVQYGYLFSQPDTAFIIAQTMYDYAAERNSEKWMDAASNYQGISMAIRGRHREAIVYFDQCLQLSQRLDNKSRIAGSLNNIGNLYIEIEDFEKSLEYFERSLAIYEEIDDINGQALALGNLSLLNGELGFMEKRLPLTQRSLELFESLGDKKGIGNALSSLGTIYGSMGDTAQANGQLEEAKAYYQQALNKYQESLRFRNEAGDQDGISVTMHGMGLVYHQLGDTPKAIAFIEEALSIAKQVGSPTSIRNGTGELQYLYKSQGRYQEALSMLEQYNEVNAQLLSEENQRAIIRQEYEFEFKVDSLAQEEEALQLELNHQAELKQKNKVRNLLLLLSSLVVLVSIGLWSRNRYIKSVNEQLAIAKERAEQSEKYKEQFLANMSHEIRTPMHAISGMVKILQRNQHPASQDVFLDAMKTSSDNLVVILNDVLDLSKIEAGKLDIESIPTNPASIINNVVQILKYKAAEKGLLLDFQIDKDVPEMVLCDPARINQILLNLVGNAIKFTEKGRVTISLSKVDNNLQFKVIDTGIGIPADKLDTIFGAFEQAQDSTSRYYGGTGLGLSISKQLIELQHGKIQIESKEGQGSTFIVNLPIVAASDKERNEAFISEEKLNRMITSLKGIRILLAEDNEFNQMIAQDDLKYYLQDVQLKLVENGALAVDAFRSGNFDLILMDVQMPKMSGFEATQKIRELEKSNETTQPIPIIAMTASLLKSEIENCYQAGMDSYIPKPYQIEVLIGEIYKVYQAST